MRLRRSAASSGAMTVPPRSAAAAGEGAIWICGYCAKTGVEQPSAKVAVTARHRQRVIGGDIARTFPTKQLGTKEKGPVRTSLSPLWQFVFGLAEKCSYLRRASSASSARLINFATIPVFLPVAGSMKSPSSTKLLTAEIAPPPPLSLVGRMIETGPSFL